MLYTATRDEDVVSLPTNGKGEYELCFYAALLSRTRGKFLPVLVDLHYLEARRNPDALVTSKKVGSPRLSAARACGGGACGGRAGGLCGGRVGKTRCGRVGRCSGVATRPHGTARGQHADTMLMRSPRRPPASLTRSSGRERDRSSCAARSRRPDPRSRTGAEVREAPRARSRRQPVVPVMARMPGSLGALMAWTRLCAASTRSSSRPRWPRRTRPSLGRSWRSLRRSSRCARA